MQNKKIMKFLCFKLHIPYNSINYHKLCKRVHLLPLKERRNISDITFVFKIASNQVDCPELLSRIGAVYLIHLQNQFKCYLHVHKI